MKMQIQQKWGRVKVRTNRNIPHQLYNIPFVFASDWPML